MKLAVALQIVGLCLLTAASSAAWGLVGGLACAGVLLVLVGVIREIEAR